MSLSNMKIVSEGSAETTKVFINGQEVHGIRSISIEPITPDKLVTATIELIGVSLGVEAEGDFPGIDGKEKFIGS